MDDLTTGDATPVRVLIVDDDPLVRSGLALILGGARTVDVVAQAEDVDRDEGERNEGVAGEVGEFEDDAEKIAAGAFFR